MSDELDRLEALEFDDSDEKVLSKSPAPNSQELKPCPFCGSSDVHIGQDRGTSWWYVHCSDCQMEGIYDIGESGAIEQWNTRPLEAALQAEVNRLKEVIKAAIEYLDLFQGPPASVVKVQLITAITEAPGE